MRHARTTNAAGAGPGVIDGAYGAPRHRFSQCLLAVQQLWIFTQGVNLPLCLGCDGLIGAESLPTVTIACHDPFAGYTVSAA